MKHSDVQRGIEPVYQLYVPLAGWWGAWGLLRVPAIQNGVHWAPLGGLGGCLPRHWLFFALKRV
jgi:hypothetical protein